MNYRRILKTIIPLFRKANDRYRARDYQLWKLGRRINELKNFEFSNIPESETEAFGEFLGLINEIIDLSEAEFEMGEKMSMTQYINRKRKEMGADEEENKH